MGKLTLLLCLTSLLTGCASWPGKPESSLIEHFGLPTQQLETADGTFFQYTACDSGGITSPVPNVPGSTATIGYGCSKRLFMLKDHVVVKDLGTKYD